MCLSPSRLKRAAAFVALWLANHGLTRRIAASIERQQLHGDACKLCCTLHAVAAPHNKALHTRAAAAVQVAQRHASDLRQLVA